MGSVPDEVLAIFAIESREILQAARNTLAGQADIRTLQPLLGSLWTLRGNAEALGLTAIATVVRNAQADLRVASQSEWAARVEVFMKAIASEFIRLGWEARMNGVIELHPPAARGVEVFLHPGNLYFGTSPATVKTVLGSCVAVCLHDAGLRMGGINHYLLPSAANEPSTKYGDIAIPALISRCLEAGARLKDLRASVFGGASVTQAVQTSSIGLKNIRLAREALEAKGIPIITEDVGGNQGRRVTFNPHTGEARAQRI